MAEKSNRRRVLLINPRFQLSILFHGILLIVIVTSLFYFYESFFLFQVSRTVIEQRATGNDLVEAIEALHSSMFPWFLVVLIGTSFIITAFLLFFSHRIAGPIYHAVNYLNSVGDDRKNIRRITFREKDYFHELAEAINRAVPKSED